MFMLDWQRSLNVKYDSDHRPSRLLHSRLSLKETEQHRPEQTPKIVVSANIAKVQ